MKLTVGNQHPRFAVIQHEGDGLGIQTYVQGIEYRANHGHAKVSFKHRRDVWQHHSNRIATANTALVQR